MNIVVCRCIGVGDRRRALRDRRHGCRHHSNINRSSSGNMDGWLCMKLVHVLFMYVALVSNGFMYRYVLCFSFINDHTHTHK